MTVLWNFLGCHPKKVLPALPPQPHHLLLLCWDLTPNPSPSIPFSMPGEGSSAYGKTMFCHCSVDEDRPAFTSCQRRVLSPEGVLVEERTLRTLNYFFGHISGKDFWLLFIRKVTRALLLTLPPQPHSPLLRAVPYLFIEILPRVRKPRVVLCVPVF